MPKLKNGDIFDEFLYDTPFEKEKSFHTKTAEKEKTAIIFLRYYGCPTCQLDLQQFSEYYEEITGENAQLVVVLQSDPQKLAQQLQKDTFPFEIICDPQQKLYDKFCIEPAAAIYKMIDGKAFYKLVKATVKGIKHGEYEGEELQLPAVFAVDKNNRVTYAHYGKSIGDIPSTEQLKNILR